MIKFITLLVVLLFSIQLSFAQTSTTIYVNANSNNTNITCGSAPDVINACSSLDEAYLAFNNSYPNGFQGIVVFSLADGQYQPQSLFELSSLEIPQVLFTSNSKNQTAVAIDVSVSGGLVYSDRNPYGPVKVTIEYLSVNNGETSNGGVVFLRSNFVGNGITLFNSTFINNQAINGGVAALVANGTVVISGCTFFSNRGSNGAILYATIQPEVYISDSTFNKNVGQNSGIIQQTYGSLSILNCVFEYNQLQFSLIDAASTSLVVDGSVFNNNTIGDGIGYMIYTFDVNGVVSSSQFTNNNGVGVYSFFSTIKVTTSTFTGEFGYAGGAAVKSESSETNINDCQIYDNTGDVGAGIYYSNSTGTVDTVTVQNNTADYGGGGIYIEESSDVTLINVQLIGNKSPVLGAIQCLDSTLTLHNVQFTDNINTKTGTTDSFSENCATCTVNGFDCPSSKKNDSKKGLIIGLSIGGVIGGVLILAAIFYIVKKRRHHGYQHI